MLNKFEYRFTIKRIVKTTKDDYIKVLCIYNNTNTYNMLS